MEERKKTAREIIEGYQGPPVRIMEVCGTHTHEIFRLGIRKLLPPQVELISGPGCPVCVTPVGFIDEAVYLALEKQVTICTFGDLVRVPGTKKSLADARAEGARIRIVYSPADAEKYAKEHPKEQVVFLSVGFETTTPAGCLSVKKAGEDGLSNYSLLVANKTMPQAYQALKGSADVFLILDMSMRSQELRSASIWQRKASVVWWQALQRRSCLRHWLLHWYVFRKENRSL